MDVDRTKYEIKGESVAQHSQAKVQQEPNSLSIPHPMTKSLKFTKRLTGIIFSVITYERGVFSENAFIHKHLSKLTLPVLSGGPDCKDAYEVTSHMRNALLAVDKGYLKDLILDFLGPDKSVLESYSISYDYDGINSNVLLNSSGFSSSQFDKQGFIDSIEELFLSLKLKLKQLEPASKAYGLRFRLTYHHQRTPETFLPKDFYDMNQEHEEVSIDRNPVGSVVLPFHSLCLGVYNGRTSDMNNDKNLGGEAMSVDEENLGGNIEMSVDIKMNCVCRMNDKTSNLFKCHHCGDWHHLVCYRRKPTSIVDPGDSRVCFNCAKNDGTLACLDSTLAPSMPLKNIQNLVVYRQVLNELSHCEKIDLENCPTISRVSEKQKVHFIDKLVRKQILRSTDKVGVYIAQTEALQKFIDSYFK